MVTVKFSLSILGFLLGVFFAANADSSKLPFWKEPDNYKLMTEKNQILVSAKTDAEDKMWTMAVSAAGIIRAPLGFTYETVKKFEELPKVNDKFEEVKWNDGAEKLFLHMSAMGYHVKMTVKLKFEERPDKKIIHFESIEGGFLGMKGQIMLSEFSPRKTEMSLESTYIAEKLPLPKPLMGIGLEFVTQRVAGAMREYIEKAYGRI